MSLSRSSTLLIFIALACASEEGTDTTMTPALMGDGSPSAGADGSSTATASGTSSQTAGGGAAGGAGQAGAPAPTSTSAASAPATSSTSVPMDDAAGAGGAGGGVTVEPTPSASGTDDGAGLGGSMDRGSGGAGGAGPGMQAGGAGGAGMNMPELGGMGGTGDDGMTDDALTDDAMTDDVTDDAMTDGMTDDAMTDDVMTDDMTDDAMTDDAMGGEGACVKGSTSGNEVVFIGESFIAASSIAQETTNLARANGSLQQGESYLNASVSGTRMGDGAIPRQYTQTAASNPIRFVLMNGGGNDCLQANDPNAPIPAAEALYAEMAADGVEKVVYFFYPDAAGAFGGPSSSLQTCLEEYRPKIKALCEGLTAPKCYWLDLAETEWAGNESAFTSDGIHPNAEGSRVTAQAIWDVMVENCVAQ